MTDGHSHSYDTNGLEIAVIGIACRVPGAENKDEFWKNLINGVESISFFSGEELVMAGTPRDTLDNPQYVKAGGQLIDKSCFDASFFGYTPLEAVVMDPQVRLFHECVWTALEDGGWEPGNYDGLIGLYAGASPHFQWEALSRFSEKSREIGAFTARQLGNKDYLTLLISHKLNLKGPSFTIYNTCSTSLVAIHLACQGLLNGECDMALAGGVTLYPQEKSGYLYQEGMVLSPDGHTRAFDAHAAGMVGGEGAVAVLLKTLEDAVADNDHIYAVIRGSAINNDGKRKPGFTAPSIDGQAEVIKAAMDAAEVVPESIGYIETHGTATQLGDTVEIEALKSAFRTRKKNFCALGSVKTNIGHLDSAAGAVGFVKAVLALYHRSLPPSLHFELPNPKLQLGDSPFFIVNQPGPWQPFEPGEPLRAGVSSFGIGGTNAHVVLQEYPMPPSSPPDQSLHLILLSARQTAILDRMSLNLGQYLKNHPNCSLGDVSYTLQTGRKTLPYRRFLVCENNEEAVDSLLKPDRFNTATNDTALLEGEHTPVIFMFPGLGAEYVGMGRELYRKESLFRQFLDQCLDILSSDIPGIKHYLYPETESDKKEAARVIHHPEIAQPLLFALEFALAKLLIAWGIVPRAMIGYSFGEYVASCIAGVLSLENALKLIVTRGRLLKMAPPGQMLSVPLTREQLMPLLPANLSLAIDNGSACIVGGAPVDIAAFETQMKARRCLTLPVNTQVAVHTHLMEPIIPALRNLLNTFKQQRPQIPYISNVSGQWMTDKQAMDPLYWEQHLRNNVCFATGMEQLAEEKNAIFVEVGPGRDLRAMAARYVPNQSIINLIRPEAIATPDDRYLLYRIGRLWQAGVTVDWKAFYHDQPRKRVPLPTYPFERIPYRLSADLQMIPTFFNTAGSPSATANTTVPGSAVLPLADRFFLPYWKQTPLIKPVPGLDTDDKETGDSFCLLVFLDHDGLGQRLSDRLRLNRSVVITVACGSTFRQLTADSYQLNPQQPDEYLLLFNSLSQARQLPQRVIHLWSLIPGDPGADSDTGERVPGVEDFEVEQHYGFYSLMHLAKAIGRQDSAQQVRLHVISRHLFNVTGYDPVSPSKATLLGVLKVVPQEYLHFKCNCIDIGDYWMGSNKNDEAINRILDEILNEKGTGQINHQGDVLEPEIALRGRFRWIRRFDPLHLDEPQPSSLLLKKNGIYLITGGLGKIGITLAQLLFKAVGARLVLTGRTVLPPQKEWDRYLEDKHPVSTKISRIRSLEASGARVMFFPIDTANQIGMQQVMAEVREKWGEINGVIHAAGLVDDHAFSSLQELRAEDARKHFQSKVYGTLTLAKLFQHHSLDFCMLLSSVSTIIGGYRFAAYAAANSFMDAFTAFSRTFFSSCNRWLCVNWDGMSPEETIQGFLRLFALPFDNIGQIVVSTEGDPTLRIEKWMEWMSGNKVEEKDGGNKNVVSLHPRPQLDSVFRAPQTSMEIEIATIFCRMFGYETIGMDDDFFQLGMDSIKSIQIRARMSKKGYSVQLDDFFKFPTLAQFVPQVKRTGENVAETDESFITQSIFPGITPELIDRLNTKFSQPIKDLYPLTPMQEGMLFQSIYGGQEIQAYFQQVSYRMNRQLDLSLVERSANLLVQRHDILRTAFLYEGLERPLQAVFEKRDIQFHYLDLRNIPDGGLEQKQELSRQYKESDRLKPFDLAHDVLIRLAVLQWEDSLHEIIWSYHHILMDGWCMGTLTSEYFAIYNSLERGKTYPLPQVPPFKTYIQWLDAQDKEEVRDYWKNYLSGYEELASLPSLRKMESGLSPNREEYRVSSLNTILDLERSNALQNLAVRSRVTLSSLFQALWSILLSRYTGKSDVVFGVVVSGRPASLEGVENMVGCFINTIPVRTVFSEETTFFQTMRALQENVLRSEPYHYFSLAEIQSQTPLKQNLLDHFIEFQNYPAATQIEAVAERHRSGENNHQVSLTQIQIFEQGNYDFAFDILPGDRLTLNFSYNTAVYDRDVIARLGMHTLNLIDCVCRDENISVANLDLLTPLEKEEILYRFNKTVDYPRGKTIHQSIREQAGSSPDKIALKDGEHHLTYSRLDTQVHCMTRYLKTCGFQFQNIAALVMERCYQMVIAILAVWHARGIYLPIDPSNPRERIDYMVKDSQATILLTGEMVKQQWDLEKGDSPDFDREPEAIPINYSSGSPNDHDIAYIIYTSGSTGKPKGAIVHHAGMLNHIYAKICDLHIDGTGIIAQNASHTFDISVWQFFTALVLGGKTVIYPRQLVLDPSRFITQVGNDHISILEVVPSYLATILDISGEKQTKDIARLGVSLKYLMVTGEEVKPALVKKWFRRFPSIPMVNAYGPTEASDDITHYMMEEAPEEGRSRIPIGHPVQNLTMMILDTNMRLCPVGVKGEIVVSGVGVGYGYLNNPGMTAKSFVSLPDSLLHRQNMPSQVYKTGDIGCWLPDGTIAFFGRKDYQVKIRGFRIELGEIENCLVDHPAVAEAVVIDGEDQRGNKELFAYIVFVGEPVEMGQLKEYIASRLPGYMVPSHIISLARIPLTANGKVDRHALPEVGFEDKPPVTHPRNEEEELIRDVWAEVLKIEKVQIDIYTDFFQMGGHSLHAVTVVSRLARDFDIDMQTFFKYPTISALAANISSNKNRVEKRLQQIIETLESISLRTDRADDRPSPALPFEQELDDLYARYLEQVETEKNRDFSMIIPYRHVMLTGATGYLGAHLLYGLVKQGQVDLYLPVRGKNLQEAQQRLQDALDYYFSPGFFEIHRHRFHILHGDLADAGLGLEPVQYRHLAGIVETVVHSAANVRHFGVYEDFYTNNVLATRYLLEFAETQVKKDFNYISTLGVCSGRVKNRDYHMFTEYYREFDHEVKGHYLESKLEAEKVVAAYGEKGLKTSIFRVGNIVFHSETGRFQKNIDRNAFYGGLAAAIKLGIIPKELSGFYDFTFVDRLAESILLLYHRKTFTNEIFHLFNHHQLEIRHLVDHLVKAGIPIRNVSLPEFVKYLYGHLNDPGFRHKIDEFLYHSGQLFSRGSRSTETSPENREQHKARTVSRMVSNRTQTILEKIGFQWPQVTEDHIKKMVNHCRETGFFQ